jgi:hypothetical protein
MISLNYRANKERTLQQAIWLMFRYLTKTLTEEDKKLLREHNKAAFEEINEATTYKWY